MRVDTKDGGDGVPCWNRAAIAAFVVTADERESRLAQNNPDVVVTEGLIKCYGCEVMELDMGTRCTAEMTLTRYGVEGELQPRVEDCKGSLLSIPGLRTRIATETPADKPEYAAPPEWSASGAKPPEWSASGAKRSPGLRGLLHRG